MRSNQIEKKDLYKKETEKGEFYFFKTKSKILKTHDLLTEFIPKNAEQLSVEKVNEMGDFDLYWGRPLKSILSIFDKNIINFKFHHLVSSNSTFVDKDFEDKKKFLRILRLMKNSLRNKE